jgi:DNA-binding response OmpR family regulator
VQIRVGVVDDELFFREGIAEVLEAAGFECLPAEDGVQALALASDPDVGVLVLDLRMPGMDGIQVLRQLREQRPALRVLVVSGATDQETVLEALRLGACDYLAKPLHDEELVLAVRRASESYAISAEAGQLRARLARVVSVTEELSRHVHRAGADRGESLRKAAVEATAELLQAGQAPLLLRSEADDRVGPGERLDASERKHSESGPGPGESLESRTSLLASTPVPDRDAELVRGICDALGNEVEPHRVLQAALESIECELSAVPVSLYLIDGASGGLVCEAQRDGGARADRKSLPGNRGLTGTVLQSGSLVATQSPELDSRYDPDVDTPEDGLPGPLLCVPIRLRGKVVGLCRVFLPADASASSRTGEVLAAGLSAAVRNVLLYRSLLESIEEVAEARREARL